MVVRETDKVSLSARTSAANTSPSPPPSVPPVHTVLTLLSPSPLLHLTLLVWCCPPTANCCSSGPNTKKAFYNNETVHAADKGLNGRLSAPPGSFLLQPLATRTLREKCPFFFNLSLAERGRICSSSSFKTFRFGGAHVYRNVCILGVGDPALAPESFRIWGWFLSLPPRYRSSCWELVWGVQRYLT